MPKLSSCVIEFYEKSNGRIPAEEFIDSLTNQEQVYIHKSFDRLQTYGRELGRPYIAYLRDNIFEIRVKTNNKQLRFLCFFYSQQLIIVTHGFPKKENKVSDNEIDKAIECRKDYMAKHAEK